MTNFRQVYGVGAGESKLFPKPIIANRAPAASDFNFPLGQKWIYESAGTSWTLGSVTTGSANWIAEGTGAVGGIVTVTGDAGGAISPLLGDVVLAGTAAQGISSSGAGNTVTFTASDATTAQKGVMETSTGAESIAGASVAVAVTPASLASKLGVQTDHGVMVAAGSAAAVTALAVGTNGQLLIGAAAADPAFATAASAGGSVTFTTGANTLDFAVTQATTAQIGGSRMSSDSEARVGTATNRVLTPSNVPALRALTDVTFSQNPVLQSAADTGAAPSGATGDVNVMACQDGAIMEQFIIGAGQTIIAPRMGANGLLVSLDLAATEGAEYNFGVLANGKHSYTIGTSPAFFVEARFRVADVTGAEPVLVGFRRNNANNAAYTAYTDYALIGLHDSVNPATVIIEDVLNGGVAVQTNTTDAWADGQTHTLRVLVSAAGVVTYLIDGIAPSVTQALTFDATDIVVPCFHLIHGAVAPGAINLVWFKCGLQ
jgi:hypothetical protein